MEAEMGRERGRAKRGQRMELGLDELMLTLWWCRNKMWPKESLERRERLRPEVERYLRLWKERRKRQSRIGLTILERNWTNIVLETAKMCTFRIN
jgi:hypothetical protein